MSDSELLQNINIYLYNHFLQVDTLELLSSPVVCKLLSQSQIV